MPKIILTALICLCFGILPAQQVISDVEKLERLAKVWGFLKYYHPIVGEGKFDWNKELITILPKVRTASDKEELSAILLQWINTLGEIDKCRNCNKKENRFEKNFDLSWIENKHFTLKLSEKLRYLEANRRQGKCYYASSFFKGAVKFKNENILLYGTYPNEEVRLLSLFNYWNKVEYFFPYKYMTDQKWSDVLVEMIPKFQAAKDTVDYHLTILELISKIDDTHAFFQSKHTRKYFGDYALPIRIEIIEHKVVVTGFLQDSLAKDNDFKVGDIILKVDGQDAMEFLSQMHKYAPASNEVGKWKYVRYYVSAGSEKKAKIEFERDGEVRIKEAQKYPLKLFLGNRKGKFITQKEKWKKLQDNIGYINMKHLNPNEVKQAMDGLMDTRGIIFDVRGYPNGTI